MTTIHTKATILIEATSGTEAIRNLLALRRSPNLKVETLAKIRRFLGMSSGGYLSDVISGRRKLGVRYREKMMDYLGLDTLERELFLVLLEIDSTPQFKTKLALRKILMRLRKLLSAKKQPFESDAAPSLFACVVLASFDMLGGKANLSSLRRLFKSAQNKNLEQALVELQARGLIALTENFYTPTGQVIFMADESSHRSHLAFIEKGAAEGVIQARKWFDRPDMSCFQSFILSVNAKQYSDAVSDIKKYVYKQLAGLESQDADAVVQLNIQIFPHLIR
jgi:uncharacterized protein (TIGR02147 family)